MKQSEVIERLAQLPNLIHGAHIAQLDIHIDKSFLIELKDSLELAEITARLRTMGKGSNAEERKLLQTKSILEDSEIKKLKTEIKQEEQRLSKIETEAKNNARIKRAELYRYQCELDALIAIANLMYGERIAAATNSRKAKHERINSG